MDNIAFGMKPLCSVEKKFSITFSIVTQGSTCL
jgi:hypothetical protein